MTCQIPLANATDLSACAAFLLGKPKAISNTKWGERAVETRNPADRLPSMPRDMFLTEFDRDVLNYYLDLRKQLPKTLEVKKIIVRSPYAKNTLIEILDAFDQKVIDWETQGKLTDASRSFAVKTRDLIVKNLKNFDAQRLTYLQFLTIPEFVTAFIKRVEEGYYKKSNLAALSSLFGLDFQTELKLSLDYINKRTTPKASIDLVSATTTKDLDFRTMNVALAIGGRFLGFVTSPLFADNHLTNPHGFFLHDMGHSHYLSFPNFVVDSRLGLPLLSWMDHQHVVGTRDSNLAHAVFFYITHERATSITCDGMSGFLSRSQPQDWLTLVHRMSFASDMGGPFVEAPTKIDEVLSHVGQLKQRVEAICAQL